MRPRCFLIEPVKLDIRDARTYGEIVLLFNENDRRPSIFSTESFLKAVQRRLEEENYDPLIDYILIAGPMVTVVVTAAEMAAAYGRIKVLMFNSNENQYIERSIGQNIYAPES